MYGMGTSGGARIIYEHANRLIDRGHEVEFCSMADYNYSWFPLKAKINKNPVDNYDAVFATYFETYYPMVKGFKNSRKFYLVQMKESFFMRQEEMKKKADRTHNPDDGVQRISIANHLVRWLKSEFGVESLYLPNGLDLEFFKPTPAPELNKTKFTILLEGGFASQVKGIGDALNAIHKLRRAGHDFEVWHLSYTDSMKLKGVDRLYYRPDQEVIPKLYTESDIMLKPSYHEGSPLPVMEAMACGCLPVVSDCDGCLEYAKHDFNAKVFKAGDIPDMMKQIESCIISGENTGIILTNAERFAKDNFCWDSIIEILEQYLKG
jgi:glycosyltransferase involved in cell wall biosynthesis